jgi:predicted HD phosphohydrolase
LQGGPYDAAHAEAFVSHPHGRAAVRLRRYDDLAKVVGLATPPLEYYLPMVARCIRRVS